MIYNPIKPNIKFALNLNIILDVTKLNEKDIDYIYTHLYHMIDDFEKVYGFLLIQDRLMRKRSRDNKKHFFSNLFRSMKKIKTPSII